MSKRQLVLATLHALLQCAQHHRSHSCNQSQKQVHRVCLLSISYHPVEIVKLVERPFCGNAESAVLSKLRDVSGIKIGCSICRAVVLWRAYSKTNPSLQFTYLRSDCTNAPRGPFGIGKCNRTYELIIRDCKLHVIQFVDYPVLAAATIALLDRLSWIEDTRIS